MSVINQFSQQQFTRSGLASILNVKAEAVGPFISIGMQHRTSTGSGIDVEIALSVAVQDMCSNLGVDTGEVIRAYPPLMRAAMLYLASDPARWRFNADESKLRAELFDGEGKGLRRRRLQELFGHQERPTHRFLIRRPGQGWSVSDDMHDRMAAGKEPMTFVLDAIALAEKLGGSCSGPLFIWQA